MPRTTSKIMQCLTLALLSLAPLATGQEILAAEKGESTFRFRSLPPDGNNSKNAFTGPSIFKFQPITLNGGKGSPYPAQVVVSGLSFNLSSQIRRFRVVMKVTHSDGNDLQVLIKNPAGQNVSLIGRVPDSPVIPNVLASDTLIFDHESPNTIPAAVGGVYRGMSTGGFVYPEPSPGLPINNNLNIFYLDNPNGIWRLYVADNDPNANNGVIEEAWLEIYTSEPCRNSYSMGINDVNQSEDPVIIPVSGLPQDGTEVKNLRVRIRNIFHNNFDDLRMLLVSPDGNKTWLLANVGGNNSASARDITIQDGARAFPDSGLPEIDGPAYRPTIYAAPGNMPAPAPAGPYGTTLASTYDNGFDPNGFWKVYYTDDTAGGAGCFEDIELEFITSENQVTDSLPLFAGDTTINPPGSSTGWSNFGFSNATFDPVLEQYTMTIAAHPTQLRTSGLLVNKSGWLPTRENTINRADVQVYASNQPNPADFNQIPNLRFRLQQRFATNSMLEVFHHTGDVQAQSNLEREVRPSSSSSSGGSFYILYHVPFATPRALLPGEGTQFGIEAYGYLPQDIGSINFTYLNMITLRGDNFPKDIQTAKIFTTSPTDAGELKVFNASAELQNYAMNFGATAADPATIVPNVEGGTYAEDALGITLSTADQPATPRVRVVSRNIHPENGFSNYVTRLRAEENKLYSARFHVTSTRLTPVQTQLRFRARTVKFSWSQKLEVGGPLSAGAVNNALAKQILPGPGTLNPDVRSIGEYGGYYTMLMPTPLSRFIRNEFNANDPLTTRMPNLTAQPGPGVAAASRRDIAFGADILDTLSTVTGYENEGGQMTIDQIDTRIYTTSF